MQQRKKLESYVDRLTFSAELAAGFVAAYLSNIRVVIMLIFAIILFGISSLNTLPRRINPEVEIPIVSVVTVYPGAGPVDVEQLVSIPLEEALADAEGLDTVSSSSQESISVVTAEFNSRVVVDDALDEVQRLVDGVSDLPSDAEEPSVAALDFEDIPIWEFVLTDDDTSRASLDRVARDLEDIIGDIASVDRVELSGLEDEELQVLVSREVLASSDINILQLSTAIQTASAAIPAGTVYNGQYGLPVAVSKGIQSESDLRELSVAVNDETVQLQDIAAVARKSAFDQRRVYVAGPDMDEVAGVKFTVYKTKAADSTTAQIEAERIATEYLETVPGSVQLRVIESRAVEIADQFAELFVNFAISIGLVFVVLLLFLGLRQAFITSLTIPLAFLISFTVMRFTGQSLNFLSMFSLLIALGLLVDDAIVIIASITEYYKSGKFTPLQAGLLVWRDFLVPIWTTTITTVWAFLPLLLSTGIIGEFIKPIPIIVSATLIASTTVAVFITLPLMIQLFELRIPRRLIVLFQILLVVATLVVLVQLTGGLRFGAVVLTAILGLAAIGYIFRQRIMQALRSRMQPLFVGRELPFDRQALQRAMDGGVVPIDWLRARYRLFIASVVENTRRRRMLLAAVLVAAVISYLLVPLGFVKSEFFPPGESDIIYVNIELPIGTRLSETEALTRRLLEELRATTALELAVAQPGAAPFSEEQLPGADGSHTGVIALVLTPEGERKQSVFTIIDEVEQRFAAYPEARLTTFTESGGPPVGSDITVKILGDDLTVLGETADTLLAELESQYPVTTTARSVKSGTSKLEFVPNESQLTSESLSAQTVGLWMRTLLSGFELAEVRLENSTETIPVKLYLENGPVDVTQLDAIAIPTNQGPRVISDLGTTTLVSTPTVIARENDRRAIVVTAGLAEGADAAQANTDILAFAESLDLPAGYTFATGGANEENNESVASILQAMILAFILILFTMVIQFKSFRQSFIVSVVIPLAICGVFIVFAITRTPLSFPSLIGILALFGIVVNNSIVIVDKINQNRKIGMDFTAAVADGSASRLEPIFFSSLTTIVGLLPITLTDPIWRGLGGAIIAGLLLSGAVMLLFIPAVYTAFYKPSED